jgi:colanic acid/amylovoran biosynthesis protein
MRVVLINQPLNNRGDEAAHKALVRNLIAKYPDCYITVLFLDELNDSVEQFKIDSASVKYLNLLPRYNSKSIIYRVYRKFCLDPTINSLKTALLSGKYFVWNCNPILRVALAIIKRSDIVICAPGGICMGGFQNWMHIAFLQMAKICKKRLFYFGRSFGPFSMETPESARFKTLSLELLDYCEFVSIRDYKTELLALSLKIKYEQTVDTAFLEVPRLNLPNAILSNLNKKYFVFVPNILIWHFAFKALDYRFILDFYSNILKKVMNLYPDLEVVMLPQTFNYKNKLMDDIHLFVELKAVINSERIIVCPDTFSSDLQQNIIARAEFLIGARYHSIVFAINNEIPFIALSYEHKIEGLLKTLNYSCRLLDLNRLTEKNFESDKFLCEFENKIANLKSKDISRKEAETIASVCFDKMISKF